MPASAGYEVSSRSTVNSGPDPTPAPTPKITLPPRLTTTIRALSSPSSAPSGSWWPFWQWRETWQTAEDYTAPEVSFPWSGEEVIHGVSGPCAHLRRVRAILYLHSWRATILRRAGTGRTETLPSLSSCSPPQTNRRLIKAHRGLNALLGGPGAFFGMRWHALCGNCLVRHPARVQTVPLTSCARV